MSDVLTLEGFRARFPEFDKVSDEQVGIAMEDARPWLDARRWAGFFVQGWAFLTAHLLWLNDAAHRRQAGASGPVTAKRAGDIQLSYATPPLGTIGDAWLMTSVYGQRFAALRRMVGMGAVVAP